MLDHAAQSGQHRHARRGRRLPRTVFVIQLEASADITSIHELRSLLKILLRRFGLRCIAAHEEQPDLFGGTSLMEN